MKNTWKEFELILALRLYYQLPFGKMHHGNKDIITLSKIINRTPSAVAMKLGNFARLDTNLQKRSIKGLTNGSKQDEVIWNLYSKTDVLEEKSIEIIKKINNNELNDLFTDNEISRFDENVENTSNLSRKGRDKQSFFRKLVVSNFNGKCCITGLKVPALLVASHIIPWAKNESLRLSPQNGFLLNSIHDKAFDRGYITIDTNYKIQISPIIKNLEKSDFLASTFLKFENNNIILPEKYLPSAECLIYHNTQIFKN